MAETLLLRLSRTPEQAATWLVVDGARRPDRAAAERPAGISAAPRAGTRRVCVLVPGTDVLLAEPDAAGEGRRQACAAGAVRARGAPRRCDRGPALRLGRRQRGRHAHARGGGGAQPPERVAGAAARRGHRAERDLRRQRPAAAEPRAGGGAAGGGRGVRASAAAARRSRCPPMRSTRRCEIARASADTAASGGSGLILYTGAAEWQRHAAQVEAVRPQFDGIKVQLLTDGPLGAVRAAAAHGYRRSTCCRATTRRRAAAALGLKAWRVAAHAAGGAAGAAHRRQAVQLRMLKSREHQVDASIRDVAHSVGRRPAWWTSASTWRQRVAAARGAGGGLLPALQALAQARGAEPGHERAGAELPQRLGGDELSGRRMPRASTQLSQSLRENGWQADLGGGTNTADGYQGRLQVHANGT